MKKAFVPTVIPSLGYELPSEPSAAAGRGFMSRTKAAPLEFTRHNSLPRFDARPTIRRALGSLARKLSLTPLGSAAKRCVEESVPWVLQISFAFVKRASSPSLVSI